MKKLITIFLSCMLIAVFSSCKKDDILPPDDTPPVVYDEITLLDTTNKTMERLAGTDALGRSFGGVASTKKRHVGMFYFQWLGQEPNNQADIFDATKLIEQMGEEEFFTNPNNFDSLVNQFHFWGEPLFGYYNSLDPWVIRRHLEMLTAAGIDFLALDTTNLLPYTQVSRVILPRIQEFREQGFNVPQIMYYTNTDSPSRIKELYDNVYKVNLAPKSWFAPNGKPVIVAASKAGLSQEILNFFEFRSSQWPGQPKQEDGIPWIDFSRKQIVHKNGGPNGGSIMNVSVSQHPGWPFSDSIAYKNSIGNSGREYYNENWGRGYTGDAETGVNNKDLVNEGANFQEQWDHAIKTDPDSLFVTGWNEWIAIKFSEDITLSTGIGPKPSIPNNRIFFVDTVNQEFSRDIEPMRGGHGDNYYMQLIKNIRAYKGGGELEGFGQNKTIDVTASVKQWESITDSFRDFKGDAVKRDYKKAAGAGKYVDETNRNDITEIRACYDSDNVYLMVSAAENITAYTAGDLKWMNVLIGVDSSSEKSFEGFNFVLNRTPNGNKTTLEKSSGGYNFTKVGDIDFTVQGKYLQFKIPKAMLGITANEFSLKLKATDNIKTPSDIMDYYISGDSAPIGRLSYSFVV